MGFADMGGGASIGAALGSAVAKVAKPRTSGRTVGRSSARTTRSSSGSSRRYSSGSSNRGRVSIPENRGGGRVKSPDVSIPRKPTVPSIAAYLGTDATYQGAVRGGKRSLADFLSETGRRRGEANTQFTQTKASMERDRVQQLEDLKNEFASRGLIQSGLYGEEQGRFQQQFTQQSQALAQQQAALLADLLSQQKNFQREQDLALEAAKQEALARRAAKYKIGA